jgi:uncharacterized protein
MPLFVLHCLDKPNNLAGRMAVREQHLAYTRDNPGSFRMGGPYLDEAGQMVGSLIVIEVADMAAAKAWAANDPYREIFETVEIRPFRLTAGGLGA